MFNVNARGIQTPNVIVGMAIFAGGLLQFIAGMWEFPRGNVFGATGKFSNEQKLVPSYYFIKPIPSLFYASYPFKKSFLWPWLPHTVAFSAYGTFWMSYAAIFIPGSGILSAYGNNKQELSNALGLYLTVWFMFTVMLMYVYELLPFVWFFLSFLSLCWTSLLSAHL